MLNIFTTLLDKTATLDALNKSQAIIEFKPDGTIVRANRNFLIAMGYDVGEIEGKHHGMFCDPSYVNSVEYRQFWQELRQGRFKAAQFKRIGKGGREVWIEASYNPVLDRSGKVYKVVKFATDISGHRAHLADLQGKADAIGRSQAVIEFTPDGAVIAANENFLGTMGYKLDEIAGRHHRLFCETSFADSPDYSAFWDALNRGEYQAGQYKRIGKGGTEVWIEACYNPVYDQNGRLWKVVKFATDITARKEQNARLASQFETGVKVLVNSVSHASRDMKSTAQSLAEAEELDRNVTGFMTSVRAM